MAETPVHEDKDERAKYELGYHLVPSLGEESLALRVTAIQKMLEEAQAVPIAESYPESRELAYTMKRLRGGRYERYDRAYFGWVRFEAPRGSIKSLEDALAHDENLVRHILFALDPAALAPAPVRREPSAKPLVKRIDTEEKAEVSEAELDKQLEQLVG